MRTICLAATVTNLPSLYMCTPGASRNMCAIKMCGSIQHEAFQARSYMPRGYMYAPDFIADQSLLAWQCERVEGIKVSCCRIRKLHVENHFLYRQWHTLCY